MIGLLGAATALASADVSLRVPFYPDLWCNQNSERAARKAVLPSVSHAWPRATTPDC